MDTRMKTLLAAGAGVVAIAVAVVVTVALMAGDGHMGDDRSWRGDMPAAMADGGPHADHMGADGDGNGWTGPHMQMGAMPGMSVTDSGRMVMDESAFIAMMIPHHEMAVRMARDVLERTSEPAIRGIAEDVIRDQEAEIGLMRSWHREWFGADPPAMPMSGAMAMMGMGMDHDAVRTADDPDLAFLDGMIPHHAGALLMADMVLAGEPRDELAGLARDIMGAQSEEIGEMNTLRERLVTAG